MTYLKRCSNSIMVAITITIITTALGPLNLAPSGNFTEASSLTDNLAIWNLGYVSISDNNLTSMTDSPENLVIDTIAVGSDPDGLLFNPRNGYLYVANSDNDTVSVIDTQNNNTLVTEIPVGSKPLDIAFDPTNGYLYVSNQYDETVSVIDTQNNNTLLSEIPMGEHTDAVTLNPANGYLYVINEPGAYTEVSVIDTRNNNSFLYDIPTRQSLIDYSMAFSPSNGYLYLTNLDENDGDRDIVSVIDTRNNNTPLQDLSILNQNKPATPNFRKVKG